MNLPTILHQPIFIKTFLKFLLTNFQLNLFSLRLINQANTIDHTEYLFSYFNIGISFFRFINLFIPNLLIQSAR